MAITHLSNTLVSSALVSNTRHCVQQGHIIVGECRTWETRLPLILTPSRYLSESLSYCAIRSCAEQVATTEFFGSLYAGWPPLQHHLFPSGLDPPLPQFGGTHLLPLFIDHQSTVISDLLRVKPRTEGYYTTQITTIIDIRMGQGADLLFQKAD